jgi:C1A family cysteine protease
MFSQKFLVVALAALSACSVVDGRKGAGKKGPEGGVEAHVPSDTMAHYAFDAFKAQYAKKYDTPEEERSRFATFVSNLKVADKRNKQERKAGGKATHGVTKFSDLSQAEFESNYLTSDVNLKKPNTNVVTYDPPSLTMGLVDWTGVYTTAVKNQGYCGSCWAFSATEQIESDGMRTLGTDYTLAPEQIVQCDQASYGCNGGWTESAYTYVSKAGGLETEASYPYTSYYGVTGTCSVDSSAFVVTVDSFTTVNGESSMTSYVQQTGPLSVCLDASTWNSYTGGIMTVCGQQVDHCVQAVGVDAASSGGYWKVRNSWGTDWGEDGYIQLAWGHNTCDISNDPTYTVVSNV